MLFREENLIAFAVSMAIYLALILVSRRPSRRGKPAIPLHIAAMVGVFCYISFLLLSIPATHEPVDRLTDRQRGAEAGNNQNPQEQLKQVQNELDQARVDLRYAQRDLLRLQEDFHQTNSILKALLSLGSMVLLVTISRGFGSRPVADGAP